MTNELRAITVQQPWADAIVYGGKTVENRGRYTSYRGRVAIHVGVGWSKRGATDDRVQRSLWGRSELVLAATGFLSGVGCVMGSVIAVADLVDCHEVHPTPDRFEAGWCCDPWGDRFYTRSNGTQCPCWHLVLADVRPLDAPVPLRGQLAVPWRVPAVAASAVLSQLEVGAL